MKCSTPLGIVPYSSGHLISQVGIRRDRCATVDLSSKHLLVKTLTEAKITCIEEDKVGIKHTDIPHPAPMCHLHMHNLQITCIEEDKVYRKEAY